MLVVAVGVVVVATWYALSRWQTSRERAATGGGGGSTLARKGAAAAVAVVVLAVLAQGCEGSERPSGGTGRSSSPPCTAYREEDCPPEEWAPPTTVAPDGSDGSEDVLRRACPAYRVEDCPPL